MQYGLLFDEVREGDTSWSQHGIDLVIDAISAEVWQDRWWTIPMTSIREDSNSPTPMPNAPAAAGKSFESSRLSRRSVMRW